MFVVSTSMLLYRIFYFVLEVNQLLHYMFSVTNTATFLEVVGYLSIVVHCLISLKVQELSIEFVSLVSCACVCVGVCRRVLVYLWSSTYA